MLGHNPVKLNRALAAKKMLEAAIAQISLKDANVDFKISIAMVQDAKELLEKA